MNLRSRPFNENADWEKAVDFLHPKVPDNGAHWKWCLASARAKYVHLLSGIHQFWIDDEDEIVALSNINPLAGYFDILCEKSRRTRENLEQIVTHAENVLRLLSNENFYLTSTYEASDTYSKVLVERGYLVEECCAHYMVLDLHRVQTGSSLHSEFVIRPLENRNRCELERWVEMIARAFNPELRRISPEMEVYYRQYHRFCSYADRGNIEMIDIRDDGVIGSSASVDIDPVNGVGEFEEVGTLTEFRRQGLARKVMLCGLHYMAQRGVRKVLVRPHPKIEEAIELYKDIGFETTDHLRGYRKKKSGGGETETGRRGEK